jgi:hypothetical protein
MVLAENHERRPVGAFLMEGFAPVGATLNLKPSYLFQTIVISFRIEAL